MRTYLNRARYAAHECRRKVVDDIEEFTMNGDNQPQQEQHRVVERIARVETAIDYQDKAQSLLHEAMQRGFARIDQQFDRLQDELVRMNGQITQARTTDFRILLGICMTTAFGTIGLIVKVFSAL
ncbi:hypothetical protein LPN04_05950 [Rugamonas sp. A1-17]|nr:hypothetical protein [Rugamonas sp. A1-17]